MKITQYVPYATFWKVAIASSQSEIPGLQIITFSKVYVKLELSGNEKFITYGATVKILPSLKGPLAKGFQTIQKIKSAFGSVYLSGWF